MDVRLVRLSRGPAVPRSACGDCPYAYQLLRDTFENWQSEFLQLVWQVAGLAMLLHIGSPQSKEGDDRLESKIDEILKSVNSAEGAEIIRRLDNRFQRRT